MKPILFYFGKWEFNGEILFKTFHDSKLFDLLKNYSLER